MAKGAGILAGLVSASLLLSACGSLPQPVPPARLDVLTFAIDSSSQEQWVLGELYMRAVGRSVMPTRPTIRPLDPDDDPLEQVREGSAQLTVSCTGELLYSLNPTLAQELAAEYSKELAAGEIEADDATWREKVYEAMMANLPDSLNAGDPSLVTACADYRGPELPQNVVPVYLKPMLDREGRRTLNAVSGTLRTKDLRELVLEANQQGSVNGVVEQYLSDHDL